MFSSGNTPVEMRLHSTHRGPTDRRLNPGLRCLFSGLSHYFLELLVIRRLPND
jgi:hypothetical protein